jgi:hypothetical protein
MSPSARYGGHIGGRFGKLVFVAIPNRRGDNNRILGDFSCDCGKRVELPLGRMLAATPYRTHCGCETDHSGAHSKYALWEDINDAIRPGKLDPVFLQFANGRSAQKAVFKGEFFPSSMICTDVSQTFLDFFQTDRFTGRQKGVVSVSPSSDPFLSGKMQP